VTLWAKELIAGLLKMDMMAMMIAVMRYAKGLFEVFASRFWLGGGMVICLRMMRDTIQLEKMVLIYASREVCQVAQPKGAFRSKMNHLRLNC
jgi:hypothetical protein